MNETNTVVDAAPNAVGTVTTGAAMPFEQVRQFDEVRQQVAASDFDKWDITVPRPEIAMQDGKILLQRGEDFDYPTELRPTSWATAQLCGRLGIPTAYFRRCPVELRDAQVNYWLRQTGERYAEDESGSMEANGTGVNGTGANGHSNGFAGSGYEANGSGNSYSDVNNASDYTLNNGFAAASAIPTVGAGNPAEKWLLRAKDDTLRAVLSERFSRLDNATLLSCLHPLLGSNSHGSRFKVEWFALGEESMHLRLIDPGRTREVLPDDALTVGIHIANSEVGKRAVTVDAMVYRLVCSNGLIALVKGKSLLNQRHLFLSGPRFVRALQEALGQAMDAAEGFVEQLVSTTRQRVPQVEETLQALSERWGLSQETEAAVKGSLLREHPSQQNSLYGLVNGFTAAAQSLPEDERYRVEVLAGQLAQHGVPRGILRGTGRSTRDNGRHRSRPQPVRGLSGHGFLPSPAVSLPAGDSGGSSAGLASSSFVGLAQQMFDAEVVGHQGAGERGNAEEPEAQTVHAGPNTAANAGDAHNEAELHHEDVSMNEEDYERRLDRGIERFTYQNASLLTE